MLKDDAVEWPLGYCGGGICCLVKRGDIFIDSSATASKSANCFKRFPDVGISGGLERYGEISAVLDVRRDVILKGLLGGTDDPTETEDSDEEDNPVDNRCREAEEAPMPLEECV